MSTMIGVAQSWIASSNSSVLTLRTRLMAGEAGGIRWRTIGRPATPTLSAPASGAASSSATKPHESRMGYAVIEHDGGELQDGEYISSGAK
jgi:hypothetical protein